MERVAWYRKIVRIDSCAQSPSPIQSTAGSIQARSRPQRARYHGYPATSPVMSGSGWE